MKAKNGSIYAGVKNRRGIVEFEHLHRVDGDIWSGVEAYCNPRKMNIGLFINQALVDELDKRGMSREYIQALARGRDSEPVRKRSRLARAFAAWLEVMRGN